MRNKAIFLDKDGTLIRNVPYNTNPQKVELTPFAAEALRLLKSDGYKLILVSNQSGIARGLFSEVDLKGVWEKIDLLLAKNNIQLDAVYYCPHHPKGKIEKYAKECACRKPRPGLIIEAAGLHNISRKDSWMIGDILDDIEAGKSAGCKTALINNGNETKWDLSNDRIPDIIKSSLLEVAEEIVQGKKTKRTYHQPWI